MDRFWNYIYIYKTMDKSAVDLILDVIVSSKARKEKEITKL